MYKTFYLTALIILVLHSCSNDSEISNNQKIKDTVNLKPSRYESLLEAYQDDRLINDTIFLGFRIGMPVAKAKEHLRSLIERGAIIQKENKLFSYIPTNEWESRDKDSVHQFIVEVSLTIDEKQDFLRGIKAIIYAPRFSIIPNYKNVSKANNPALSAYKEIVGDSLAKINREEKSGNNIKRDIEKNLLPLFRVRYGTESHIISDELSPSNHIWVSQGRLIELSLQKDYLGISKALLGRKEELSKNNFSELVEIGSISYYKVADKLKFQMDINKASVDFQNQADSTIKRDHEKENEGTKERAKNSGI